MNTAKNLDSEKTGEMSRPAQTMFHRVLRAEARIVRDTLTDIRRRFAAEIDEDALGRLELVLAEVLNNVAEHGPGAADSSEDSGSEAGHRAAPLIHLCIVRLAGMLSCAVTDDGISLPAGCLLPPDAPAISEIDLPEGGFGWFLIHDLTQELYYYREERRNFLAFRVPVSDETAPASPDSQGDQFSKD
ncbi:ATP-binding protein [Paracoccus zhejiangensis]|uniref:ATP-binding protein n=1 Tax=Paracoccus zhejiangensis TaxID=1077935 RepID=A0A2H5F198_9RHOB|nr:ATP-binding protein [Paracoccus zhejiangensis]AUH65321.1 ATP-binding protein [Paracoccus zhejiangensis]